MRITAAISCFLSCAYRRAVGAGLEPAPDRVHAPARRLPDATHTLRAGPYSRVLDASAVPSRRIPYNAGRRPAHPGVSERDGFPILSHPLPSSSTEGEE